MCGEIFTCENDLKTHKRENSNNTCDNYSYEDSEDEDLEFVQNVTSVKMLRRKTELLDHKNKEHKLVQTGNY